ncbi:cytochrome bc complex cytochrome b subunit [Halomicrobium salinisoli]|uniref:cytochrome bc complex cytochrome b subunit n=1 Tax=Halomicrobium salinisoli TaxID=2878391 RepID=UPI001CF036A3|nr:cytochrome bc complex cytochrome b subunit [Halomicrobium salinisoli]
MSETSDTDDSEPTVSTDGGATGIVPPDDETPTWSERKERRQGLARLTYEYFERSRREDQDLRERSDYVERDVLGFPAWPHEAIRNLALATFFVGTILYLAAALPPEMPAPANAGNTPSPILPDWYLYWSFGLLQIQALNPELTLLGGQKLMADRTYGVLANVFVVVALAVVPFLNKGAARRPVENPFWAAVGMAGVAFSVTTVQHEYPLSQGRKCLPTTAKLHTTVLTTLSPAEINKGTRVEGDVDGVDDQTYSVCPT